MTKVTNNHNGLLNVAGTDVRPGATVEVDDSAFDKWSNGNAAKIWLKSDLISTSGKVSKDTKKDVAKVPEGNARLDLEKQAAGLGVSFSAETTDDELLNAVLEAEETAKNGERETLLKEARDLGLNPNANTGTEKLKKLIAEKKSSQG